MSKLSGILAGAALPILAIYAAAALFVSLPVLNSHTLVGEGTSAALSYFATWWPTHALPQNYDLVQMNYMAFPVKTNWLPVLSLSSSFFYALFRIFAGPVLGFNLLLPFYLFLNAAFSFFFIRRQTKAPILAAAAGFVLAFNPLIFQLVDRGELHLTAWYVFPLALLLWDRFFERPVFVNAAAAFAAAYLAGITSLQFYNLLIVIVGAYVVGQMIKRPDRKSLYQPLFFGALIFAVLFYIHPASPLLWSVYLPIYKPLEIWQGIIPISDSVVLVFLAVVLGLSLSLIYLRRGGRSIWMIPLIAGLIFYYLPEWSPQYGVMKIFDTPNVTFWTSRHLYLLVFVFGAVLFCSEAAAASSWFAKTSLRLRIGIGIAAGAILLAVSPLRFSEVSFPQFYSDIASEPEDYVIVHYPLGVDSAIRQEILKGIYLYAEQNADTYPVFGADYLAAEASVGVPIHQKRLIGGLSSHFVEGDLNAYENHPLLRILANLPPEAEADETAGAIRSLSRVWRIAYIVLHSDQAPAEFMDGVRQWLSWSGAYCLAGREGSLEFWRARWHPAGCPVLEIDLGSAASQKSIESGWYGIEDWGGLGVRWAGGEETSVLTIWLNPGFDHRIILNAAAPQAADEGVDVVLVANDHILETVTLHADFAEIAVTLPRESILPDGKITLELRHSRLIDTEGRQLSAVYDTVRFEEIRP